MKRQAGPQHCSDNHFLPGQHHRNRIDRSLDRPGTIIERFTDFISHHFPHPFQITPESHAVLLNIDRSDLRQKSI